MFYLLGLLIALLLIILTSSSISLRKFIQQIDAVAENPLRNHFVVPKSPLLKKLAVSNQYLIQKNIDYYQLQRQKEQEIHQVLKDLNDRLRTPLSVSTGYTEVLHSIIQEPNHLQMLEKIDRNLLLIGQYIDYQTEYNLILEKKFEQQLQHIDFSKLIKDGLVSLFSELKNRQFTFSVTIAENTLIYADLQVINRILFHFFENVRKHGSDFAEIELRKNDDYCELWITNGINQKISHQELLINQFNQIKVGHLEQQEGLGLLIAAQLIDLAGGQKELTIENKRFSVRFSLPLIDNQEK